MDPKHQVTNRRDYYSTTQGSSPSRKEDLSLVTYSKLYTAAVEYCSFYT